MKLFELRFKLVEARQTLKLAEELSSMSRKIGIRNMFYINSATNQVVLEIMTLEAQISFLEKAEENES